MFSKVFTLFVFVDLCWSLSYDGRQDYLSNGISQNLLGNYPSLGYSPGNYLGSGILGNQYSQLGVNGLPFSSLGNNFNRELYPQLLGGLGSGLLQGSSGILQGGLGSGLLQGSSGILQGGLGSGLSELLQGSSGIFQGSGYSNLDQLPNFNSYNYQNFRNGLPSLLNYGRTTIDGSLSGIINEYRQDPIDGSYAFGYESDNGIRRQESGNSVGPSGAVIKRGSYSFRHPDGTPSNYNYIADENGFRIRSNLLPTLPNNGFAQAGLQRPSGIFGNGRLGGIDTSLQRSSFLDSHRQNSLPLLSSRSATGRVNDFDDLAFRNQRSSSSSFGRGRGPFSRNIQRDTFDASDPHTGGSTLSGHVKRENKNQEITSINDKLDKKSST